MIREIFTIRVVYKSGYHHDFDVYSFEMSEKTVKWESADPIHRPVKIGIDNIESVWQIASKSN